MHKLAEIPPKEEVSLYLLLINNRSTPCHFPKRVTQYIHFQVKLTAIIILQRKSQSIPGHH